MRITLHLEREHRPMKNCHTCCWLIVVVLLSWKTTSGGESLAVQHTIAAIEHDRFHGWPANNGVWQWGTEILVGLTQGDFEVRRSHNITGREDSLLTRSVDGGKTWTVFDPEGFLDDDNQRFAGEGKTALRQPMEFSHSGFAMRIFSDGYHGNADPEGGFFCSDDRGSSWQGPFSFQGLTDHEELNGKLLSPRTDYLVQGKRSCLIFISVHGPADKNKRIACIQTEDGGLSFDFVAWVTPRLDDAKAIMCQTVQLAERRFVTSFRLMHFGPGKLDTIEAWQSMDRCLTWHPLSTVKVMPTHSNPPALVKLQDGRLCCAYGDRHAAEIRARYSNDEGRTWGPELIIRDDFQALPDDPDFGLNADMGYVRLVQRPDEKLVAIYYWATAEHPQQHIAVTIWQP